MTPESLARRIRIGRDLLAHRITPEQARRRLCGDIGLGADDVALMHVMAIEAEMLADGLPLDIGQQFSTFAQQIEDPAATLRMALEAETGMQAERAA